MRGEVDNFLQVLLLLIRSRYHGFEELAKIKQDFGRSKLSHEKKFQMKRLRDWSRKGNENFEKKTY